MMPNEDEIVAIALLTKRDLDTLGSSFRRVFPVDGDDDFSRLLKEIEAAEAARATPRA